MLSSLENINNGSSEYDHRGDGRAGLDGDGYEIDRPQDDHRTPWEWNGRRRPPTPMNNLDALFSDEEETNKWDEQHDEGDEERDTRNRFPGFDWLVEQSREDGGSKIDFEEEDFRRLMEQLESEEFTQINGLQQPQPQPQPGLYHAHSEETGARGGREESPDSLSVRGNDEENILDGEIELLDDELEELDQEEDGPHDEGESRPLFETFSRLEGLTELELTDDEVDEGSRYSIRPRQTPTHNESFAPRHNRSSGSDSDESHSIATPTPAPRNQRLHQRNTNPREGLQEYSDRNSHERSGFTLPERLNGAHDDNEEDEPHGAGTTDMNDGRPQTFRSSHGTDLHLSVCTQLVFLAHNTRLVVDYLDYDELDQGNRRPYIDTPIPKRVNAASQPGPSFNVLPSPLAPEQDIPSGFGTPSEHASSPLLGSDVETPRARPSAAADDSPFHDMLVEARNECQSLRALNERLLRSNEDMKARLVDSDANTDEATYEKEKVITNAQQAFDERLRAMQQKADEKSREQQEQIQHLKEELMTARAEQSQLADIRANLKREKDLDILTIKKELLMQKERQLQDIRKEMAKEKEDAARKLEEENRRQQNLFSEEKERLQAELLRARDALSQKDDRIFQLESTRQSKPQTSDFGQQHDTLLEITRKLQDEFTRQKEDLDHVNRELGSVFGDDLSISPGQDSARSLMTKCRERIQSLERSLRAMRGELDEKAGLVALLQQQRDRDVASSVQETRRQLEEDHQQSLRSLKSAHIAEISNLKVNYEAQISNLNNELVSHRHRLETAMREQSSRANAAPLSNIGLSDLIARYPSQFIEYRTALEAEQAEHRSSLQLEHARELESVARRNRAAMAELEARCDMEKDALSNRHREEISVITTRLKEQCSQAYDTAISKLKGEYVRLEQKLAERMAKEKEAYAIQLRQAHHAEIAALERRWRDEGRRSYHSGDFGRRVEELEVRILLLFCRFILQRLKPVFFLKSTVANLRQTITTLTEEHNRALLDVKQRAREELQQNLQKMKTKYLDTLRMMRDDLARGKQQGLERLETEWKKRKETLDNEWQQRYVAT
ncbi:hypothetical protein HK104_009238 [Borealophlyctis nickersoniae]|nr:hypothetical protein HK104_009238 [Borealophlyctis nickersoniae]